MKYIELDEKARVKAAKLLGGSKVPLLKLEFTKNGELRK